MARNPKPLRRLMKLHGVHGIKNRRMFNQLKLNPYYPLRHYILHKQKVIEVAPWHWAVWFEYSRARIIKVTRLPEGVRVSTVFLGMDHGFGFNDGPPVLFETMIFGGDHSEYQRRYTTYADALAGHQRAIELTFEVTTDGR